MARRSDARPPALKRAALYARVSTTGQETEGTSLGTQEEAMRAHAAARGYHRGSGRARRPETHLLRGGYARCGHCGGALYCGFWGSGNSYYYCGGYRHEPDRCTSSPTITGSVLDRAVWSKVEALLTRPEVIAAELERLRSADPDEADLAALDRALLDLSRRQANLSRVIGELDREDAEPLVRELRALGQQKRQLEADRNAVMGRRAAWRAARERLEELQAWCGQVAARLTRLDHAGKQLALDALGVSVVLYQQGHVPRYVITARIPLAPGPDASAGTADEEAGPTVSPTARAWLCGATASRSGRPARRVENRASSSGDSSRHDEALSAVLFRLPPTAPAYPPAPSAPRSA